MRSGRPLVALAVVVATLGPVAGARADGDPASDTLYSQRVYYPYAGGSKAAAADLDRALAVAARRGVDVRIALIAQDVDLGAVPQLFGQAQRYAQFLSSELPPTPQ